jgi:hypothetical protein
MDKIIFTDHAKSQMREREISEKAVKDGLKNPDKIILQNLPRFRALKKIRRLKKSYLLVVVFDKSAKTKEVVTVFYTSKLSKYL